METFAPKEISEQSDDAQNIASSSSALATASSPPPQEVFAYTAEDFETLCENSYNRFLPNSKIIGHAVIHHNGKKTSASQFTMPFGPEHPSEWVQLKNIHAISRFGITGYAAQTLDGKPMYSNRGYQCVDEKGEKFEIRPFSPPPSRRKEPFWGSKANTPITTEPVSGYEQTYKAGREVTVDKHSVEERSKEKRRTPSQNQVMGGSAQQAYEAFFNEWNDTLTPKMREIFQRAIDAPLHHPFLSNYRPEWLHAEGHSLTPLDTNPQREDNLGAGPKWANTAMMVLERIAKWFTLNCPDALVTIKPMFEMLFESDLIKSIDFEAQVGFKDRYLRFIQHLEPLQQKAPVFKKSSDIAQLMGITHAKLCDKPPVSNDAIKVSNVSLFKGVNKNMCKGTTSEPIDQALSA